jgi:WD40 repeat protein
VATTLRSYGGFGPRISFSPDGRTVALLSRGRLRLWRPQAGVASTVGGVSHAVNVAWVGPSKILAITHAGEAMLVRVGSSAAPRQIAQSVGTAAISGDGRLIAINSLDFRTWTIRRVSDGRLITSGAAFDPWAAFAFDPSDSELLAQAEAGLTLHHRRSGRDVRLGPGSAFYRELQFSHDGRLVVASDVDGRLRAWDSRTHRHRFSSEDVGDVVKVAFSADDRRLLTVSSGLITLRSTRDGHLISVFSGTTDDVTAIAFSPGGALVATAHGDGKARLWDAASGSELLTLRGHSNELTDVAFSPNGRYVITTGADGSARLWAVQTGAVLGPPRRQPVRLAATLARARFAIVTDEGVQIWNRATDHVKPLRRDLQFDTGLSIAASEDGRLMAAGMTSYFDEGNLIVFDARHPGGKRVAAAGQAINGVAFSPDGRNLLSVGAVARLWNTRTWRSRPLGHIRFAKPDTGAAVAYSQRPDRAALATSRGRVQIVDPLSGAAGPSLNVAARLDPGGESAPVGRGPFGFGAVAYHVALSPDGAAVAVAGPQGVLVWNPASRRVRLLNDGHTSAVNSVAFDARGTLLVTAGSDRTTRIWDARTLRNLATDDLHAASVVQAFFTADRRSVASVEGNGTLRFSPCLPCRPLRELVAKARTALIGR